MTDAVNQRAGIVPEWPEWHDGAPHSAAAERKIREILDAPLTADGAALIAVLASPDVQVAYADLEAAGGKLARAHAPSNPQVVAALRFPLSDNGREIELSAVASVTDLVAIWGRVREADARLAAARQRAIAATLEVAGRARAAFFGAAAAQQILGLRRSIAEATSAAAELAKKLREAGNITELDAAREAIVAEDAGLAVSAAEADEVTARERLRAALGLSGTDPLGPTSLELPGTPSPSPAPVVANLEDGAVAASLELAALRSDIEAAGERIGVARFRSWLPDLGVGVSAKREADGWGIGPMIALSLPIFDWGQGERASAWAELHRRQELAVAAEIEVRARARAAAMRLAMAYERAREMATHTLPLRAHIVEEGIKQANAMSLDPFELLVLRKEELEAEIAFVVAQREYWLAATEVDQLRAGAGRTRMEWMTEEARP